MAGIRYFEQGKYVGNRTVQALADSKTPKIVGDYWAEYGIYLLSAMMSTLAVVEELAVRVTECYRIHGSTYSPVLPLRPSSAISIPTRAGVPIKVPTPRVVHSGSSRPGESTSLVNTQSSVTSGWSRLVLCGEQVFGWSTGTQSDCRYCACTLVDRRSGSSVG